MKKFRLLYLLFPCLLVACSPRVTTMLNVPHPPLDYTENVKVFDQFEPVPKQAEVIGTIKVGDSGFTVNCGWDLVLERARTEARKAGGNALKIIEHRRPDLGSTCHRITATILKMPSGTEAVAETESYYTPMKQPTGAYEYEPELPSMRLGVNGGWSSRIAKVSDNVQPDLREYVSKLKRGFHLGADASYYFSDQMGLGLKYSYYRASNSMEVYATPPGGSTQTGSMSDQVNIHFIGPTLNMRYWDMSKKNAFHMGFGLGYMSYLHNKKIIRDSFQLSSGTFGASWDLGYDIGLDRNTALGFQLSFMAGTLTQYDIINQGRTTTYKLEENNYESLARIDLSVGLRFMR